MAMSRPRIACICASGIELKVSPFRRVTPVDEAVDGKSRMMLSAVIDLPDPDAPTNPRISPARTSSDTFLIMRVAPMATLRSMTSSSGAALM